MNKRIYLPLTLLMAFSAHADEVSPDTQAAEAVTVAPETVPTESTECQQTIVEVANPQPETAPVQQEATPVQQEATPVQQEATPAQQEASVLPTLPTEDDINKILSLFEAYDKQSNVIRNLQDLATTDTQTVAIDKTTVRSLLTLLEVHKRS